MVEAGDFGGTCLNVGCIPTKMFVYPADVAEAAREAANSDCGRRRGVDWTASGTGYSGGWTTRRGGRAYRQGESPNITRSRAGGEFTAPRTLACRRRTTALELTGDRFVIATGSRPGVPDILGLETIASPYDTSDTVMRIDELPSRIAILGGGYIAAEFAHVFASFGSQVTQLVRAAGRSCGHDHDISDAFGTLAAKGMTCGGTPRSSAIEPGDGDSGVTHPPRLPDGDETVDADVLLIATGRAAEHRPARPAGAAGSGSTTTARWWSTSTSAPPSTASSRSAT